jgi:ectoine hydroxylase-related dioxygenase (phytanoyl-CoA dioxygenase family)
LPGPLVKKLAKEVLRLHERGILEREARVRDIGGRYAAVLPFEGVFLDPALYANPKVLKIMASLLGEDFCIGSLETVISRPGAGAQHQHVDGPIRFDVSRGGKRTPYTGDLSGLPPYAVTLCVPLCDVDDENGPTVLRLGSHKDALRPRPPGEREVARKYREARMTAKAGEAFIFDFRIFHGGTANWSRAPRPLLIMVFTRTWFRDPNLNDVFPSVVITKRNLARVPARHRRLFMLAPAARRTLWRGRSS